jgi:hypothetical protein
MQGKAAVERSGVAEEEGPAGPAEGTTAAPSPAQKGGGPRTGGLPGRPSVVQVVVLGLRRRRGGCAAAHGHEGLHVRAGVGLGLRARVSTVPLMAPWRAVGERRRGEGPQLGRAGGAGLQGRQSQAAAAGGVAAERRRRSLVGESRGSKERACPPAVAIAHRARRGVRSRGSSGTRTGEGAWRGAGEGWGGERTASPVTPSKAPEAAASIFCLRAAGGASRAVRGGHGPGIPAGAKAPGRAGRGERGRGDAQRATAALQAGRRHARADAPHGGERPPRAAAVRSRRLVPRPGGGRRGRGRAGRAMISLRHCRCGGGEAATRRSSAGPHPPRHPVRRWARPAYCRGG